MRQLHRYILTQFLFYLLVSVSFFAGILLAGNVMKTMMSLLIEGKLSLGHMASLLVLLLPSLISYALPFGFVAATLLTLGALSSDNEYIALKSSGISPLKIFSSIFFISSCGVLLVLFVNFYYAPKAVSSVRQKIQNIIREEPLKFITPQKFINNFPGYILFVKNIERGVLKDFHIWELDNHGNKVTYIEAETGMLEYDSVKNALLLTLLCGSVEKKLERGQNTSLISFEKLTLDLLLKNIFKEGQNQKKIRHMTLTEMLQHRAKSLASGDRQKYMEIQVEMQTKCAMAFAVLALVLMTIPLSIKFGRKEVALNTILAVGICIGYYGVMMLLSFLEKRPHLRPDLLVWIPNLLLQIVGIKMIWQLCRR